ncbi:MAG: hypothetical protein J1E16_06555 [Muribaculaceae bacterium]|nr:hypothetical protein [Muribaculaceae bacterium]
MTYWRVKYIDKYSGGKVSTTVYYGDISEKEVIEFFGLENEDVYWYELELIEK